MFSSAPFAPKFFFACGSRLVFDLLCIYLNILCVMRCVPSVYGIAIRDSHSEKRERKTPEVLIVRYGCDAGSTVYHVVIYMSWSEFDGCWFWCVLRYHAGISYRPTGFWSPLLSPIPTPTEYSMWVHNFFFSVDRTLNK